MESKISAIMLDHKYIHCEFRSFFFTFTSCHFRLCQFFPSVIVNLAAITCASSPLASRDHHAKSKFRNSSEIIKFAGVHGPNYVWLWRPHERIAFQSTGTNRSQRRLVRYCRMLWSAGNWEGPKTWFWSTKIRSGRVDHLQLTAVYFPWYEAHPNVFPLISAR